MDRATPPLTPEQSKLLFGNSFMSTVLIEIASMDAPCSASDIIRRTGFSPSVVIVVFRKLREAGLIEYIGRSPNERTKLYRINDSPWWHAPRVFAADRRPHSPATLTIR